MKAPFLRAAGRMPPRFVANFDSASAMMRATARYLRGLDFPMVGMAPGSPPLTWINALPEKVRETIYVHSGWGEALPATQLHHVRAEEISRWVVNEYPHRQYPAVMVGSSSGALVHLCAALGVPWLPQTWLVPVRQSGIHPDEFHYAMEAMRDAGRALLDANPELQLHHMHDPNQDRLMIQHMAYFRVKRRTLGETYERFLSNSLQPGGTVFVVQCRREWQTTKVGERHYFQAGALGGASPKDFFEGTDRVAEYLRLYHSHRRRWEPPPPDGLRPEAEWGFEPMLRSDIRRLAHRRGWRVRHIVFEEPEHLSPFVADLYRWWNASRGLPANRLLVESFVQLEPYWTLKLGAAPFWMKFNMDPSLEALDRYLEDSEPFDDIRLMLFSHGVQCVGLPPIERWESLLRRHARVSHGLVGVDREEFPRDFASMIRYHTELKRLPPRYALPPPLEMPLLDTFIATEGHRYQVRWLEDEDEATGGAGHRALVASRR
jgi:hypothetical protein